MKKFETVDVAIRYLTRTFLQDLSNWADEDKWCERHQKVHKYYFGCTVSGQRHGFDSDEEVMAWANSLAFGPGGSDGLWAEGVATK